MDVLLGSAAAAACFVCVLAAMFAGRADAAQDGDLARLKANLLDYWIGAGADRDDPLVAASLRRIEDFARSTWQAMRPDGSWADIDYEATSGREFQVARHVSRIAAMAEGFRTPGQPLCGERGLARAVEQSLSFIHDVLGERWPTSGGWWQQQIHTPRKLGETLLLMEGNLSPAVVAGVENAMRYLLMENAPRGEGVIWHVTLGPTDARPGEAQRATGENMVWLGQNHLYLALLTGDAGTASQVQAAIASECTTQSSASRRPFNEGIMEDYSFHQHGPLLYTGGYGRSFFEDVPQYLWAARGTRYQLPQAGIETFARYVLDSSLWCIYENYYDPSCRGREIARPERRPMDVPLAVLVLANLPNSRRDEAVSAAKKFYEINPSYELRTAPLWAAIKDSPIAASAPVGHRHFWESDYTIHRTEKYFASLRMFSNRTRAAECINDEGKTSWHQSDGLLWVFLRGADYAANDVLPTLDWLRLPGTTVERKHLEPTEGIEGWPPPLGRRAFVGGAFTDDGGASAMELAAAASVLTARKSWFFFGDSIVCLGSDINCPSDNPAETIVNQRPLSEAALLTVDGQTMPTSFPWEQELAAARWAQCDEIGYYFPEPQPLKLKWAIQSGSWRDLSSSNSDAVHSKPFLTLWFDHGPRAENAAYSYVVLPRRTAAETEAYAASPPITVLAHHSGAHAARDSRRGAAGAVFWQPGSVDKVSVDRPCIVFWEEHADGLTLAVSEPTHQSVALRVTIDEPLTPARLPAGAESSVQGGQTVLTLQVENGRNYIARFGRTRG